MSTLCLAIYHPFGIITNGDASWQRRKVEAYGIHKLTPHIFVSGAFGAHKPAPSIFQAAAKALELPPEEILFVGDHPIYDIWGAHRVGMHTAWIDRFYPWPRHLPRSIAEITVHSLAELCKLFEVE